MTRALAGRTALVNGASSGIGAEFARQLAARGCDVILVARREERLAALKAEIDAAGGGAPEFIAMDLAQPDAPARLHRALTEAGVSVDVLVNDAGFGIFGEFLDTPWERIGELLALDVVTLTHLTYLFAAGMTRRNSGHILLAGRASIVAGWRNTALAWASRLGPRQVNARVAMRAMKRARKTS